MSGIFDKDAILAASAARGLMAYLFDMADPYLQSRQGQSLSSLAEVLNSGEVVFFSEEDWAFLDESSGPKFFSCMALFCDLIPMLEVDHRTMLRLVATLVRRGGADLAANQPNVAFRNWCVRNPVKGQAIMHDAKLGKPAAIDHLCFVLEAGDDVSNALAFLTADLETKTKCGAATALGRMTLDGEDAFTAIHTLAEISYKSGDDSLRLNSLLAIYSILEKHSTLCRSEAQAVLDEALSNPSAEMLNGLAHLIWMRGGNLTADEVVKICMALRAVDIKHGGTLQKIDHASSTLLAMGHFEAFSHLIEELVRKSKGDVGFADFPHYRNELLGDNRGRLGKTVISCFLEANVHMCSSLCEQLDALGKKAIELVILDEDLPEQAIDQVFLCRKAVGFLFSRPVTAASVLVAVLRHGHSQARDEALALLYDPLLLSYRGDLLDYLEEVKEESTESGLVRLNEVVVRIREYMKGLEGIETLVELQPSESRRQIERVRHTQKMTEAMDEVQEKSIFHGLMTTQYLIYGTTSSFFMPGSDGDNRFVSTKMGSHSVSIEYPQLTIFDPEGLEMMLFHYRHEKRLST